MTACLRPYSPTSIPQLEHLQIHPAHPNAYRLARLETWNAGVNTVVVVEAHSYHLSIQRPQSLKPNNPIHGQDKTEVVVSMQIYLESQQRHRSYCSRKETKSCCANGNTKRFSSEVHLR